MHAESLAWERYFAASTRKALVEGQTAVPEEGVAYEPLPWVLVRKAVGALELAPNDVFVDYGSGLGRALLMAARLELKKVLGVELLGTLAQLAERNVLAARHRLRTPVEIVVGDASAWSVPDDVTVAYFFNPFNGSVMKGVQDQLRASLVRRPRPLRVLYIHPQERPDLFASCDWLSLRTRVASAPWDLNVTIYEHAQAPRTSVSRRSGTQVSA